MAIIPAGKKVGESIFGEVYQDKAGNLFWMIPYSLQEIIEAHVTNGRGYLPGNLLDMPYSEHPYKKNIVPEIYCYRRLKCPKFPGWKKNLEEGHPSYRKGEHEVISL